MSARRTWASTACSETRNGESLCATMRSTSASRRFVNVANVPVRKLRRKSSSRRDSDGRICSGSWRMKQNVQAFRQVRTPSKMTPSKESPQSSPGSRSSTTVPASPSLST